MRLTSTSIETLAPGSAAGAGNADGIGSVGRSDSRATSNSTNSDSVNLSSAAALVNLAKSAAPDRSSKVASVAALVRSGQYSSDAASVSQAVVQGSIR
jgi:anti-sigma28 factor (negative regulator of flagellin synthesis)